MYNYISSNKLVELVINGRIAFIVTNVTTKNILEYINNCIITLRQCGFDTSKLTQPNIFNNSKDKTKNIVFIVRKGVNKNELNIEALNLWMKQMENSMSLTQYLRQ